MENKVRLNEQKRQFELLKDGKIAFVKYECSSGGMNFIRTFVPEAWRGKGVGTFLSKHALNYAREHHWEIEATCPFIQAYINKYTEIVEE